MPTKFPNVIKLQHTHIINIANALSLVSTEVKSYMYMLLQYRRAFIYRK